MLNLANNLFFILQTASTTTGELSAGSVVTSLIMTLGFPILMIVVLWFLLIRPQRKEEETCS